MKNKQKPLALACYICGRQFGTKSLQIHLKNCKEKFATAQAAKEKKDRIKRTTMHIKVPEEPARLSDILSGDLSQAAEYNQEAFSIHKYRVLPACQYCGRTFNEESLIIHQKVCSKDNRKNNASKFKQNESSIDETIKKPRTLVCCVCGRQFGLTSLKIHYPQCVQKFKTQQMKKGKKERREVPQFSPRQIEMINSKEEWTIEDINAFNGKAAQNFKEKGMVHCQNCKRSFLPEPYKRHLKNCELLNGNNIQPSKKKAQEMKLYEEAAAVKKPKVLQCHICGRQFGLLSILIHQKTCKTKFINNQQLKPRIQRKTLPLMPESAIQKFNFDQVQKWTVEEIQQYNKIANDVYRNQSMVQCPLCHRKFIQTSFLKHKGYCEKQHQKQIEKHQLQQQQKTRNQSKSRVKLNELSAELDKQQVSKKKQKQMNQSPSKSPSKLESLNKQAKTKKVQNNQELNPKQLEKKIKPEKKDKHIEVIQDKIQQMPEEFEETKKQKQQEQKNKQEINEKNISIVPNKDQCKNNENPMNSQQMKNQFLNQSKQNIKQQQKIQSKIQILGNKTKGSKQSKKEIAIQNQQLTYKQKLTDKQQIQNKNIQQMGQEQKNAKPILQQGGQQQQSIQLSQCYKCGRKFLTERLAKHEGICKGTKKQFTISKNKFSKALKSETDPPNVFRQSKDISNKIQLNQDTKIIEVKEEVENLDELAPMGHSKLLVPCNKCGRKFLQNRVQKHEQSCKNKILNAQKQKKQKINLPDTCVPENKQKQKQTISNIIKPIQFNQPTRQKNNIKVSGEEQYQQISEKDMKGCSKCGRKFKSDRIDIHQNVCKGSTTKRRSQVQLQKELENNKNTEIIKKTKENFFTMVKQINSKKVKQQDIDRQLDIQLQSLQKQAPIRQIINNNKPQGRINQANNFRSIDQSPRRNMQSQLQKVTTWKRKAPAKHQPTHLPGI